MSKPEKMEDISPNDKKGKNDNNATKIILMNIVTTAIVCSVFIGVFFIMQKSMISEHLSNTSTEESMNVDAEVADDQVEKGIILDLGDFTMNLADTNEKRYLKVAVALEITKTEADIAALSGAGDAKQGGHGGHGAAPAEDPAKKIAEEMEHYKPAIRDAVITIMTSKVADELTTTTGKELAKDQIKDAVDAVFAGEREVIRVSFGEFIIQ